MNSSEKVLIIAGLDSSSGAGLVSDCITIRDFGCYPLNCVTTLTAQSFDRICSAKSVDFNMFKDTLDVLVSDNKNIKAVKISLVSDLNFIDYLIEKLSTQLKGVKVVFDPILKGTKGSLNTADIKSVLKKFLPYVDIFTPNLYEAEYLSDSEIKTDDDIQSASSLFRSYGAKSVIIKGGHSSDDEFCSDYFQSDEFTFVLRQKRTSKAGVHGGGCALSSALAALLAKNFALHDAAVIANAYTTKGVREPDLSYDNLARAPFGHHGLNLELKDMPYVLQQGFPVSKESFAPCPLKMGLYPVVDSYEWIEKLVNLGVKTIQLRIKDKQRDDLYLQIQKSVEFCKEKKVRLFIDDHYELAIKAGAYGVHLGMEDLLKADVEKIRKSGLRLGVSTHGAYETLKAVSLKPSYIALGHIFETQSKIMPSKPQGVYKLSLLMRILKSAFSTVAIGGIKLDNVKSVVQTGVGSVALITGITKADDVDSTVKQWLEICSDGGESSWK